MNTFEKLSINLLEKKYLNTSISLIEDFPYCRILNDFAKQCNSITEINAVKIKKNLTFTWCLLHGLFENVDDISKKEFTSVTYNTIGKETKYARDISQYLGIDFNVVVKKDDKDIDKKTDMMFIHTNFDYDGLMQILESNFDKVNKYIIVYDSEFLEMIKKNVFSLGNRMNTMSVENTINGFLESNKSWGMVKGFNTEYAFVILKRVEEAV